MKELLCHKGELESCLSLAYFNLFYESKPEHFNHREA